MPTPEAPEAAPRRILALDGGGVRGMLSLQYLRIIEEMLRSRYGRPELRLCEYFDLIGGTSTGAIIAAGLALGLSVDEIEGLYVELATRIFRKPWYAVGALSPKFSRSALVSALQDAFGADTTLGSPRLKTGLLVVAKRMDTGSSWVVTNCPRNPFFLPVPGKKRVGVSNLLLWQLVRASTAAPHFFKPEMVEIGSWLDAATAQRVSETGEFVDGGVTPFNNPSLACLRAALIPAYGFAFEPGADRLLLISVGTGLGRRGLGKATGLRRLAGVYAMNALTALMDDCATDVELTLQWLSTSDTARPIDGLVGRAEGHPPFKTPWLTYQRYNIRFEHRRFRDSLPRSLPNDVADGLTAEFTSSWPQDHLDRLAAMDRPNNMAELKRLGALVAATVQPEHFPSTFDRWPTASR